MNFKNPFAKKKPEAPGDSFLSTVDKAYQKNLARMETKEARQRKIEDCAAILRDCRFTFNRTIGVENALAGEMQRKGFPTTKQHDRVRDAAIGILVVDHALYELKSINSEADLNSAMNKMGMALRQLRRIDNSSAAVSSSTEKIIRQWYPEGLSSEAFARDIESPALPQIPVDVASVIDESFVQGLMMGDSFELRMLMRQQAPKEDPTRADRDDLMDRVRAAALVREPENVDAAEVIKQHSNKF